MKSSTNYYVLSRIFQWTFCCFIFFKSFFLFSFVSTDEHFSIKERVLRVSPESWLKFHKGSFFQKFDRPNARKLQPQLLIGKFGDALAIEDLSVESLSLKAHSFIQTHPRLEGLAKYKLKINEDSVYIGENEQFLKFHVLRDGLVIHDAFVDFRFKFGRLVQVVDQSFSYLKVDQGPFLNWELSSVLSFLSIKNSELLKQSYRIHQKDESSEWLLLKTDVYHVVTKSGRSFTAYIASSSGEVLDLRQEEFHFDTQVTAVAYPRWYQDERVHLNVPFLWLRDGPNWLTTDDKGQVVSDFLKAPVINSLEGLYARVVSRRGRFVKPQVKRIEDSWYAHFSTEKPLHDHSDHQQASLMAYIHVNEINQKAKKFVTTPWLDEPLLTYTNLRQSCNAHWDGISLNFYSASKKCANTALIADIIYHEWGHGFDANTGGIMDSAFSEGFSDIMSLVMTGSSQLGVGFRLPEFGPVRDLEDDKIYPDDQGESHHEGLIIASTFWDLFEELQKSGLKKEEALEVLANYAFKMIFTASTYLDVYESLLVIDDDDDDPNNKTPHYCLLNQVFGKHGLASIDEDCTEDDSST